MKKCERSEQIKEEPMKEAENVLLVWSCMQYEAVLCCLRLESGPDGRLCELKRQGDASVMASLRLSYLIISDCK